jgi:phosphate transport system substrate-binding protein
MLNNIKGQHRTLVLVGALAIAASTINLFVPTVNAQSDANTIKIDGSSTVYPITEAAAEEFQKSQENKSKTRVTVGISGTGGGFKKFCKGETDISDASRPISAKEIALCKENDVEYLELAIGYDALTVVVNPKNDAVSDMTFADLKKIWEPAADGKVTNWNQVNSSYPDAPLKLYGPGADSGTFDYFTEAVVGKAKESRKDFTASEDDNVLVQGVSKNKGALGYFGFAYYEANTQRLKAVKIEGVEPTKENVLNDTYKLSRPLFIYVSKKSIGRGYVREFVDYYMKNAKTLVADVKYIPLKDEHSAKVNKRFQNRKLGSGYEGKSTVDVTLDQALNK